MKHSGKQEIGTKEYPAEIMDNGGLYGFKSANLMYLQKLIEKFNEANSSSEVKAAVPAFVAVAHKDIEAHLNQHASVWQGQWDKFVNEYNNQANRTTIEAPALDALAGLRATITDCFTNNIFNVDLGSIDTSAKLMVRSTGKEDSTTMANPGGNESQPSTNNEEMISGTIGAVIASYFGEKSLAQRLLANDDITKAPFMPCLIQHLIGEGENSGIPYSGVMYAFDNNNVKIQAAPGHGEYVVNSKGSVDTYHITSQGIIYPEIQIKDYRIVPILENGKMSLQNVDNDADISRKSSLPPLVAKLMSDLAKFIQVNYGMNMDIEFAYDPATNTINIVQARPIPEGERASQVPSSLSPEYLAKIIEDGGAKLKGGTITTEVKQAAIINSNDQIIVCGNIEEALSAYLASSNKSAVKAVIVSKDAPSTSHEAGEFSSKGIAVLRINDIQKVEEIVTQLASGKTIIVDPQRKSVFQLGNTYHGQSEEQLKQEGVIKEGLSASTLSSHTSPVHYEFAELNNSIIEDAREQNLNIKLGDLVDKAQSTDPKVSYSATIELVQFLRQILDVNETEVQEASLTKLQEKIEILSNPSLADKKIVQEIYSIIYSIFEEKGLDSNLAEALMISCAELILTINRLKASETSTNKEKALATAEYLNIYTKLEGLINAEAPKGTLANSVKMNLAEIEHASQMKQYAIDKGYKFNEEDQATFNKLAKLQKLFINKQSGENWLEFCLRYIKAHYGPNLLETVEDIVKLGIEQEWLNIAFTEAYEEACKNYKTKSKFASGVYNKLEKDFNEIKAGVESVKGIEPLIKQLEGQIDKWKEPKNFKKLYQNYPGLVKEISDNVLSLSKEESPLMKMLLAKEMHKFVDVMDLTIKAESTSILYSDKIQQAKNFKMLIATFAGVLEDWKGIHHDKLITVRDHHGKLITVRDQHGKLITALGIIIKKINEMLLNNKDPIEADLHPSASFNVSYATMDNDTHPNGWNRILKNCNNLEDLFTLIHQNLMTLVSKVSAKTYPALLEQCSPTTQHLCTLLSNLEDPTDKVKNTKLTSVEISDHKVCLKYNIALDLHSAHADVVYDSFTDEVSIAYSVCGANTLNRWDQIELISAVKLGLYIPSKLKITKYPNFDKNKNTVSFELQVETFSAANYIVRCIDEINDRTYDYNSGLHTLIYGMAKTLYLISLDRITKLIEYFDVKYPISETDSYVYTNDVIKWQKEQIALLKLVVTWSVEGSGLDIDENYIHKHYPNLFDNKGMSWRIKEFLSVIKDTINPITHEPEDTVETIESSAESHLTINDPVDIVEIALLGGHHE